jgi:hypothetical protein
MSATWTGGYMGVGLLWRLNLDLVLDFAFDLVLVLVAKDQVQV